MKTQLKNILVPVNFSGSSVNAVNTAARMCKRHGAALHLVYVFDTENLHPVAETPSPYYIYPESVVAQTRADLDKLASTLNAIHSVACHTYVEYGWLAQTISIAAQRIDASLIVVGHSAVKKPFLSDSIAYRILQKAPCPVLAVPVFKKLPSFKTVLFPVRPVTNNIEKYVFASPIIRKNDADTYVLSLLNREDNVQLDMFRELLYAIKLSRNARKLHFLTRSNTDSKAENKVLSVAGRFAVDLIVITGSTDRNVLEYFLGNYTQKVLNNSRSAVLAIKPGQPAERVPVASRQTRFAIN